MSGAPADNERDVIAAVDAALGAVLEDKDVVEVAAIEGGLLQVVRRGRRERLQAIVEGPLFSLLRERGAESDVLTLRLPSRARLVAGPLQDGRVALAVHKPAPTDVRFEHLVEEGLLPPGVDAELVTAVLEGQGVAVLGPSRTGRQRLTVALARALSSTLRCQVIGDDIPAGCVPAPGIANLVARARSAVALGADVVIALDLTPREAADLAAAPPGAPLVAAISAPAMATLRAAFAERAVSALFPVAVVVAHAPDGRPRLLEMHGGAGASEAPPPATTATSTTTVTAVTATAMAAPAAVVAPTAAARPQTRVGPSSIDDVPLPPLGEAPPAEWASSAADDDPGWELGSLARTTAGEALGSFDAALAAASKRPTFTPRSPAEHPQARALKGTGGLTFEPPGGPSTRGPGGDER